MARQPPQSFTYLFLSQNSRTIQNPKTQIRSLATEEFAQTHHQQKPDGLTRIAKEVSRVIRTLPRWEQSLISDFPNFNFLAPNFFPELLKQQNNVFLSLRFFYWLSSHNGFVPDKLLCNLIFDGRANATKSLLGFVDFSPEPGSLEGYIRCLKIGQL